MGNRRYARGRAYVADRFTNPENAEAATLAAAAASEGEAPIDESVEETVSTPVEETVITPADETAQSDEEN